MTSKLMRTLCVVMLIVFCLGFASCGGGGADVKQETNTTTLGKQLEDLDSAYKKGLLSEKEYNEARKKIMKKYTD